jgi:hypothetical protein
MVVVSSTTDRIEKLIALSASSNEHEARSAAFLACKLIREGGFRVIDPERPSPPPRPRKDVRPRRRVESVIGRAKRSGRCTVCDEPFEEGSDVAFPSLASDANLGAAHADCRSRWSVPA